MGPKRIIRGIAVLMVAGATAASGQGIDEELAAALKAAYLCSIAQYATWPDEAFSDTESPIIIQVLGEDPHGIQAILNKAVDEKGISAQRRPIAIRVATHVPDGNAEQWGNFEQTLKDCHLLFLTGSEKKHWDDIHTVLAKQPVVTISEIKGFAESAGMIEFAPSQRSKRGDKVGIDMHINLEAVREAELRLSAKLLGLKKGVKIVRR